MWLTFTNAFDVFTSSALNVNSSGLSLTITSLPPSGAFGFRTLNVPVPRRGAPTSSARSLSTLNDFPQAVRETFSALLTQILHNIL